MTSTTEMDNKAAVLNRRRAKNKPWPARNNIFK